MMLPESSRKGARPAHGSGHIQPQVVAYAAARLRDTRAYGLQLARKRVQRALMPAYLRTALCAGAASGLRARCGAHAAGARKEGFCHIWGFI